MYYIQWCSTSCIELGDDGVQKGSESGKARLNHVLPISTKTFLGSRHSAPNDDHKVQCSPPPPSICKLNVRHESMTHLAQTLCVYASGMIAQDLPAENFGILSPGPGWLEWDLSCSLGIIKRRKVGVCHTV